MADERSPCSVVLEGGVTSAVIYAALLQRLSRYYTFRHLGGTSSGAVAAAAAAAAEYARQKASGQSAASFDALGRFPSELAATDAKNQTTLIKLFQPKSNGLASFRVAMAALDPKGSQSTWAAARRVGVALIANFWLAALLAAVPVVGIGFVAAQWLHSHGCEPVIDKVLLCAAGWMLAVLLTAVGAAFGLALWALWVTVAALRGNHWGLCNGMTNNTHFDQPALTPTLHGFFQSLAGLGQGRPLTFGDLWGPPPKNGSEREKSATRQIDLQIIATNVSLARPMRLPGEHGANPLQAFFYDPLEWGTLFPPDIIEHLKVYGRRATLTRDDGQVLLALPEPEHWPVLMAARFSLSFPVLLSAVPMYVAVPRRKKRREGDTGPKLPFEARKVYFSDGGITSNCPVHLFDAPLPGFPTFGINLYKQPSDKKLRVSRSDTRDPELEASATPDAAGWTTPLPFLLAIFSTMLSWRDSLQRSLRGYRERIVHIGVQPKAGGLHLAMESKTIRRLERLGKLAAERLHSEFSTPRRTGEANAWERHRWARMRTTLSALRAYLGVFVDRLGSGEPDYSRLLRTSTPLRDPFQNETARQQALALMEGTRELIHTIESSTPADALDQNTPQPLPDLHLSPPW